MADHVSGMPHQEERWASEMDAVDGYLRFKKQQQVMGRDVRRRSGGSTTISGQSSRSASTNSVVKAPLAQQNAHPQQQPRETTPSAPPLWQLPPSHISTRTTTATSVLTWSTDDSREGGGTTGGYDSRRHKGGGGVRRPPLDGDSGSSSVLLREFSMSDSGGPLLVSDRRDVVVDEGLFQELHHGRNSYHPAGVGATGQYFTDRHHQTDPGDVEDLDSFLTELSQYERQSKRKIPPPIHPSSYQVRVSPTPSPAPQRTAIQPDSLSTVAASASRSRGQSTVLEGGNSRGRDDGGSREGTPMVNTAPPPPPPSSPPPPPRHAPVHEELHHQHQPSPTTTPPVVLPTHHDGAGPANTAVNTATVTTETDHMSPSPPVTAPIDVPTAASMEAVHDACGQVLEALNTVHQQAVPRLQSVISSSVGDVSLLTRRGHTQGTDTTSTSAAEGGLSMGKEVWGFYTNVLNRRYADPVTAAHHTRIRKDRLVQIRRDVRGVNGDMDALATRRRDLLQNN